MPDIMLILGCVSQCLDATTLRQLSRMTEAMLSMTGRVTMRGMSRWTGKGGSYRTLQRFFTTTFNWGMLQWMLIRHHLLDGSEVIVMADDDVVVTKSGKKTHGLGRYFSSLYGKTVPGLCFLTLSLMSVTRRSSYPVITEQVEKEPTERDAEAKKKTLGKRGRPKGRKNRHRREVELSPYLCCIQTHIKRLLELIGTAFKVVYFVYDGAFGHNGALQMVRQTGLHLISKLR